MIAGPFVPKPRPRLIRPCIAAGLVAAGGVLALGLPGAVILQAAMPLVGLVTPHELGPDQVWPAALGISLMGPFAGVPVYVAVANRVRSRWPRVLVTIALTLVAVILASAVGIALSVA